ncbi:UNVERIFIED_ORG: diguanylate cyclase [Martelella mediterranea]
MPDQFLHDRDNIGLEAEWDTLQDSLSGPLRRRLAEIVRAEAPHLARQFYSILQNDEDLSAMLPDELVRNRLVHTLKQWLLDLFPEDQAPDFLEMVEKQLRVGSVHARINLPVQHVNRAWRMLAEDLQLRILKAAPPPEDLKLMLRVSASTLNIAFETMTAGYARETTRSARSEEAYRLFSLGQNLTQEREAQRAAIAEWTQTILFSVAADYGEDQRTPLWESEFGLWLIHRGGIIFEGMAELDHVKAAISEIDSRILPALHRGRDIHGGLALLQAKVNEIKSLLGECFNAATRIEGGHDPQTRMLNRRFMDTVLTREIGYSRKMRKKLTVMMIDLDHFKQINDRFGHAGGDIALQKCAKLVLDMIRIGDFAFRYGGEEFLIALVETGEEEAMTLAERLRTKIANTSIEVSEGKNINITASIGIAEFKGHPDYMQLVKSADEALYGAKQNGRNCIIASA